MSYHQNGSGGNQFGRGAGGSHNQQHYNHHHQQQQQSHSHPHHQQQQVAPYDSSAGGSRVAAASSRRATAAAANPLGNFFSNFGFGDEFEDLFSMQLAPFGGGASNSMGLLNGMFGAPHSAGGGMMSMMPTGASPFGNPFLGLQESLHHFNNMAASMPADVLSVGGDGGHFQSQVMVFNQTVNSDGHVHVEKYARSDVGNARHRVRDTKEAYSSTAQGVDRLSHTRQLGERGHRVYKERSHATGEVLTNDEVAGMERTAADDFDSDWREQQPRYAALQHQNGSEEAVFRQLMDGVGVADAAVPRPRREVHGGASAYQQRALPDVDSGASRRVLEVSSTPYQAGGQTPFIEEFPATNHQHHRQTTTSSSSSQRPPTPQQPPRRGYRVDHPPSNTRDGRG